MAPRAPASRRGPPAFVERHALWNETQHKRADDVAKAIKAQKLEQVRFSFADQHGVLRGKSLTAAEAISALKSGVAITSNLLARDTADNLVFPLFTPGGGVNSPDIQGGGDVVMVADPATFRVLPWAPATGWLLCDLYYLGGQAVPFSARNIYRAALARLASAGFDFSAGLEVEFHLFRIAHSRLTPEDATVPPQPPDVTLISQGHRLLSESQYDQLDPALEAIRRGVQALGLPLRSVEAELGPSQVEFTFRPFANMEAADAMILFRSAARQIARRHGYLASFMARPALPNLLSSGWHLHQSLIEQKTKMNAFALNDRDVLSTVGRYYLGGLLTHARAAAALTTPTINGYKRYRGYSLAPDRATWARQNRGVMVRVLGQPGDPHTHLENRVGEPAANPYLSMAAQIYSGLDGVARRLEPGPATDIPYEALAALLPKNLSEALTALRADDSLREGFGAAFIAYYSHIKEAEIARFRKEARDDSEPTAWEHKEYFDLF